MTQLLGFTTTFSLCERNSMFHVFIRSNTLLRVTLNINFFKTNRTCLDIQVHPNSYPGCFSLEICEGESALGTRLRCINKSHLKNSGDALSQMSIKAWTLG